MKKLANVLFFVVLASLFSVSASAQSLPPGGGGGGGGGNPVPLPTVWAAPTCTMTVDPGVIQQPGGSATIFWTTENATAFSIDQGIGGVTLAGSRTVSQKYTVYYSGTVTGPSGTATCGVNVGVQATNLTSDWFVQFEKGSIVSADEGGAIGDFPLSFLNVNAQSGLLYMDGSQIYQGAVPDWSGSWAYIRFVPNVRPGQQKFAELSINVPDTSFGAAVTGMYNITCKLYVEASETYGWGVMIAEYREPKDAYVENVQNVPDRFYISTCRMWQQPKQPPNDGKG